MIDPSLTEVIDQALDTFHKNLHTCTPGVIEKYDSETMTATVAFGNQKIFEKEDESGYVFEKYPVLYNVPVLFPSAGTMRITFPIQAGDPCLIIFSEDDLNNYRGNVAKDNIPALINRNSIGAGMCIPVNIKQTKYSGNYSDSAAVVVSNGGAADFVALQQLVMDNFNALKSHIDSHTHAVVLAPAGTTLTSPPTQSPAGTPPDLAPDPTPVASSTLKAE